jgi:hypothetical protein
MMFNEIYAEGPGNKLSELFCTIQRYIIFLVQKNHENSP